MGEGTFAGSRGNDKVAPIAANLRHGDQTGGFNHSIVIASLTGRLHQAGLP
jgi:hypothetical protein